MSDEKLEAFRNLEFMESRVPPLDALSTFVSEGSSPGPKVERILRGNPHRWYPAEGGHRVLVLFEGESYDQEVFAFEPKGWDHDHCAGCGDSIPAMTVCWVTTSGKYVVVCTSCKAKMDATGGPTRECS